MNDVYGQTGKGKSNMVAFKLEVPISQLIDKIATESQRLYICFRDADGPHRRSEIQDGDL